MTKFARIGEKVTLDGDAENKNVTWFFNDILIAKKRPKKEPFVDNEENYQLMDNGDLIILKMTVSLEGKYERIVGEDRTYTIILKLKTGIYGNLKYACNNSKAFYLLFNESNVILSVILLSI